MSQKQKVHWQSIHGQRKDKDFLKQPSAEEARDYSTQAEQANLFIVKHNLLPVNTTIILIIIVLVLIHN